MLERVVYVSQATTGVGLTDAYDIIRTAHNRNSEYGLTGALALVDGWFVQVLEGDAFHVRERYERISADPRHADVDLREQRPIDDVSFPGEWMALRSGAQIGPELREQFGYSPGFPAEQFDGERLHAFLLACWSSVQQPA